MRTSIFVPPLFVFFDCEPALIKTKKRIVSRCLFPSFNCLEPAIMVFRNRSACAPLTLVNSDRGHRRHHGPNPYHSDDEQAEKERVRHVFETMLSDEDKFEIAHKAMQKVQKLQELAFTATIHRSTDLGRGGGGGGGNVPSGSALSPQAPLDKNSNHAKKRVSAKVSKCPIPMFVGFETHVEDPEPL
jgi:hypothetical protein